MAPRCVGRHQATHFLSRHELVLPNYMRKASWRLMDRSVSWEAARFVQGRLGELRVNEARYEDLLTEVDRQYPEYLKALRVDVEGAPRPVAVGLSVASRRIVFF